MFTAWSPDDIWLLNPQTGETKPFLKSAYNRPELEEGSRARGWFRDLCVTPDGQYLFYVCQPGCPTTWSVRRVNTDGTDDRWISWGHDVDIIGVDPDDPLYGCVVIERPATDKPKDETVICTPDGTVRKTVTIPIEDFWSRHQPVPR